MKKPLGPVNALYPSLTTIVGTLVEGRPNFLAVAHVGIMNHGSPQYISVSLAKAHYTNRGIHAHGEFSVNIPSQELVAQTDYVGLVSGKNTDKSTLFDVVYGELAHAPMIGACPVCMECRLERVVDFPSHDLFVGEIVATHADPKALTGDGKIDIAQVQPLLFDMASLQYWSLGTPLAQCWSVGKALKTR